MGAKLHGQLVYSLKDLAFNFIFADVGDYVRRWEKPGVGEIIIDNLIIEVSLTTRSLLYLWGYSPHTSWQRASFPDLTHVEGLVILDEPLDITPPNNPVYGVTRNWNTFYDPVQKLCCVAQTIPIIVEQNKNVEFAEGIIATIVNNTMQCIWLKPKWIS